MFTKQVMVTGVYGLIAGAIYKRLRAQPEVYDVYALARRRHPSVRVAEDSSFDVPGERFVQSDLSDLEQVTLAVRGMDVVVHVERCVNAPESLRFDIFYGLSNNKWRWVDIEHARKVLGYEPQDRGENFYPA